MELLPVAHRKMEHTMLGFIIRNQKRNTWIRPQTCVNYIIYVIKKGIHIEGGIDCQVQRQHMDYKNDRVATTRMDKTAKKT